MTSSHTRSILCCLAGLLALGNAGCSLLFVKGPPAHNARGISVASFDCTSSKVAPVFDTIFTGLEVARTLYAVSAPDSVYRDPKQPLSRGADIGLGLGFTALFLGSAIHGYSATSACEKYKRLGDDKDMDEDRTDEPILTEEPRRRPLPSTSPRTSDPGPGSPEPDAEPPPSTEGAPATAPTDSETGPAGSSGD